MCEPGRGLSAILCSLIAEWSNVSPVCPVGGEFNEDSCNRGRFASLFASLNWNEPTLLLNLPVRSIFARAIVTLTRSGMLPRRKASTASLPSGPCKRYCIFCALMPYTFAPGVAEEGRQRNRGARGDGVISRNAQGHTCATSTVHTHHLPPPVCRRAEFSRWIQPLLVQKKCHCLGIRSACVQHRPPQGA